jgi:cytochrome d ubiquinol oxidase subunit II
MALAQYSFDLIAFAVTLYLVLDGFDLGIGILLFCQPDQRRRDRMIDAIAPTWDGNETWLILAAVGLLAAFPIAYGILLPAFYLPLILMLLALGLRGVSFEFRHQPNSPRRLWDAIFAFSSVTVTLAQGFIGGALLVGVAVKGHSYSGGAFDWFSPFSTLTAVTHVAGNTMLGLGWLYLKGDNSSRATAIRQLRWLPILFAMLSSLAIVGSRFLQPGIGLAWMRHPAVFITLYGLILLLASGIVFIAWRDRPGSLNPTGLTSNRWPWVMGMVMFVCVIAINPVAVFPQIIPFRLSLWDAASTTSSHVFFLTGAACVIPVIIGYSVFAYWVFRGQVPEKGWAE